MFKGDRQVLPRSTQVVYYKSGIKDSHGLPVAGACPAGHPVAVPMLEFKIAYRDTLDNADLRLSSGRGYSWHADFFAAWDPKVQAALVTQCINGGGQCDARGYDARQPGRGRVLDAKGRLLGRGRCPRRAAGGPPAPWWSDDEQFVAGLPSARGGRATVVDLRALSPPEQTARCREARPRTGRVTQAPATGGPAARR